MSAGLLAAWCAQALHVHLDMDANAEASFHWTWTALGRGSQVAVLFMNHSFVPDMD